jgi:thioredoxin reductase (NADPH)
VTFIVPAVLGGVALTVMALVSVAAGRKKRLMEARALADANQPRILVHDINDDRCTGCDACVAVCPTNVLDLVDNKSRVLRFQDCIQCEQCMWACPTEALVMHIEGTEPPKLEVPELDDNYQTAVPGQYLIGEVAGKPLVKNAANIGRGVVEHMLSTGLRPGGLSRRMAEGSDAANVTCVDVAIVGSGPGGLSAALTCIQRGLSYVVLEKEQLIASTIARYPKGKLVMAEPYDVANLSFLPVFDSSKEQLLPIWKELIEHIGVNIKMGEAVEQVERRADSSFDVRTTVGAYRSQRVVLATGTRGKPRTLGVKGENLAKVQSLLDDPDDYRGKPVCVIGGGDSAVEAAIALADAGAKVLVSYRGRGFSRCQPKNRATIESYAAQRRIKVKYQSTIAEFGPDTITVQMADGSQKKYPNAASFVLIGAEPPVKWLGKLGIQFIERPHSYALPASDALVRRFVADARECPEAAVNAAALVRGEAVPMAAPRPRPVAEPDGVAEPVEAVSGPRKWLRSATSLFSTAHGKKVDRPMPLSEFARRSRRRHTGDGRRDQLDAGERTRVLRMLRDEGGRIAHDESAVYLTGDSELSMVEASPLPEARIERNPNQDAPMHLPAEDSAPKQAVIVGLARAMAEGPRQRRKRRSSPPPVPPQAHAHQAAAPPARPSRPSPPPPARSRRPSPPPAFNDDSTRQLDTSHAQQLLRDAARRPVEDNFEESTRAADFDPRSFMQQEEPTRAVDVDARFLHADSAVIVSSSEEATGAIDIDSGFQPALEDESTFQVDVSGLARLDAANARFGVEVHDETTRALDLDAVDAPPRQGTGPRPRSLSDVEWDLD